MANLNKVLLIGRLTRDPELRYTPSGKPVCDLGLAVNKTYEKDKKEVKETVFIDVVVWNKQAESTAEYMKKGKTIFIEGELKLDTWMKDDEKRSKLRVVARSVQFLSLMKDKSETQPAPETEPETEPEPEHVG